MARKKISERSFDNPYGWVAVVVSEWNREISNGLLEGMEREFKKYPGVQWKVFWVTGAFEIPLMLQRAARMTWSPELQLLEDQKKERPFFDVLVALGCVMKGKTYHFDLVTNECARGCMDVMLRENIPVVFEVLACKTMKDAKKRSSGKMNAGQQGAYVALDYLQNPNAAAHV
jgi:6,7-dimethyl-8-ribityllumazine synthase